MVEETLITKIYPDDDVDVQLVKQFRRKAFWSLKDFAEFLGISYRTAWSMVKEGKIKAVKIGGEWKIHYQTVVSYIKERNSYNCD